MKCCKKQLGALLLAMVMMLTLALPAAAMDETNADRLYELGLFKGTGIRTDGSPEYALGNQATRLQGLIMLTRLLGEEKDALDFEGPCPFADVPAGNPSRYVAYAYDKGYTTGTTDTTFSPGNKIGFKHYVTFLLRALGYRDQDGDFSFAQSIQKAADIGMVKEESALLLAEKNPAFYRGDLVDLSVAALTCELKDSPVTLATKLAGRGVFSYEEGELEGVLGNGKLPYHYQTAPVQPPVAPKPTPVAPKPVETSAVSRKTGTYSVASGQISADVITVDLSDPGIEVRAAMVNNTLGSTANFADIVAGTSAKVVVNGNFFNSNSSFKIPIGHVMVNGEFFYGVSGLSSVGFTESGEARFGRPAVFYFVEGGGQSWACYETNSGGQDAYSSVLYNPAYGSSFTMKCDGVVTTVVDGTIQSSSYASAGSVVPIPANGFTMFFGNAFASTDYYRSPRIGNRVSVNPRLTQVDANGFELEGVTSILSGAPRLVEGGAICTTLEPGFQEARFTTNSSPRTAVGKLANGKLVIVSANSATIQQMRELMLQLGCVDAINLDGGASRALAMDGKVLHNAGRPLTTTLQVFVR